MDVGTKLVELQFYSSGHQFDSVVVDFGLRSLLLFLVVSQNLIPSSFSFDFIVQDL